MKLKTAILTIAAAMLSLSGGVAVASDAEGNYTQWDGGVDSCATFLRVYRTSIATSDYSESNKYLSWISGFMTAAGLYNDTQKPFGDVADRDGFEHLVREHCKKNPLDRVANAAEYIVEVHLLPKAGKR